MIDILTKMAEIKHSENHEYFTLKMENCETNMSTTPDAASKSERNVEPNVENGCIYAGIPLHMQSDLFFERFQQTIETTDEANDSWCHSSNSELLKEEYRYEVILNSKCNNDGNTASAIKHDSDYQIEESIDVIEQVDDNCESEKSDLLKLKSVKSITKQSHKCEICGKDFSKQNHLMYHFSIHTGEAAYQCPICYKSFTHPSSLTKHQLTHSGVKKHLCQCCGKAFAESGSLKKHLLYHSGEKPHVCIICTKPFTQAGDLKKHLRIHNGQKPY